METKTIIDYGKVIDEVGFEEYPYVVTGQDKLLKDFIDYNETDLDLKIHLTKVIICRSFSSTGGIYWPDDVAWFIDNFFKNFEADLIKPWLSETIKEAIKMTTSGETFTKEIFGTTFMFGVVEFYAKYLVGWRPEKFDFFDKRSQDKFRKMYIGDTINKLKKTKTGIAKSLNEIDNHNTQRLKEVEIRGHRWTISKIADRLSLSRNTMLHGENHSFYDKGRYLIMLYILFHLHALKNKPGK